METMVFKAVDCVYKYVYAHVQYDFFPL